MATYHANPKATISIYFIISAIAADGLNEINYARNNYYYFMVMRFSHFPLPLCTIRQRKGKP